MTTREEMQERVLLALERFDRQQMKPRKVRKWGKAQRDAERVVLRKPARANLMQVWCSDEDARV